MEKQSETGLTLNLSELKLDQQKNVLVDIANSSKSQGKPIDQ